VNLQVSEAAKYLRREVGEDRAEDIVYIMNERYQAAKKKYNAFNKKHNILDNEFNQFGGYRCDFDYLSDEDQDSCHVEIKRPIEEYDQENFREEVQLSI
jgi:hypothetical protein